jgi:hypothetical protein
VQELALVLVLVQEPAPARALVRMDPRVQVQAPAREPVRTGPRELEPVRGLALVRERMDQQARERALAREPAQSVRMDQPGLVPGPAREQALARERTDQQAQEREPALEQVARRTDRPRVPVPATARVQGPAREQERTDQQEREPVLALEPVARRTDRQRAPVPELGRVQELVLAAARRTDRPRVSALARVAERRRDRLPEPALVRVQEPALEMAFRTDLLAPVPELGRAELLDPRQAWPVRAPEYQTDPPPALVRVAERTLAPVQACQMGPPVRARAEEWALAQGPVRVLAPASRTDPRPGLPPAPEQAQVSAASAWGQRQEPQR